MEALAAKMRKTRRPEYDTLVELARNSTDLPCQPSQELALLQLLVDFESWEVRSMGLSAHQ